MIFRLNFTPVNINGITEGLKCIKGNPDREQVIVGRNFIKNIKLLEYSIYCFTKKVKVFEKEQGTNVYKQGEYQ